MLGFRLGLFPRRIDKFDHQISAGVRLVLVELVEEHSAVVIIGGRQVVGKVCLDGDFVVKIPHERPAGIGERVEPVARQVDPVKDAD